MISLPLYIGPGLGLGTIVLSLVVVGIVLFSLGYIVWLKIKNIRKGK